MFNWLKFKKTGPPQITTPSKNKHASLQETKYTNCFKDSSCGWTWFSEQVTK